MQPFLSKVQRAQLNYIANTLAASSSGRTIPVKAPLDGQLFDDIQRSNASDIDEAAHGNGCVVTPVEAACLSSSHQARAERIG